MKLNHIRPSAAGVCASSFFTRALLRSGSARLTLLFFFVLQALFAQTWTGNVSTNWHTPGNWSTNSVPGLSSIVNIPDVTNDPVISGAAVARFVWVQAGSNLAVAAGGSLAISGALNWGFDVYGRVENNGTISINNVGADGLLMLAGSSFTNKGTLQIGNKGNVGYAGIGNEGTFVNESGGAITVDRTGASASSVGAINNRGSFTNKAAITIGGISQNFAYGLWADRGAFENESGGTIKIARVDGYGLHTNPPAIFKNKGTISIGTSGKP